MSARPSTKADGRFDFTLIIPSDLAPHDWHPNGRVTHDLRAEIEGLDHSSSSSLNPSMTRFSSPCSPTRSVSPSNLSSTSSLSATRQQSPLPSLPAYPEAPWLRKTYQTTRSMMFAYNPHPTGGYSVLEASHPGSASGLGPYDIRLVSAIVRLL